MTFPECVVRSWAASSAALWFSRGVCKSCVNDRDDAGIAAFGLKCLRLEMNTCLLSIINKELLHASKATSRILVPWYKTLTSLSLTESSDVWFAATICLGEIGRSFCTPGIKGNLSFVPSSSSKKLVQTKRSSPLTKDAADFLTRALVSFSTWLISRTVLWSKEMVFSLPLLKKTIISLLVDTANSEISFWKRLFLEKEKLQDILPIVDTKGISKRTKKGHSIDFIFKLSNGGHDGICHWQSFI